MTKKEMEERIVKLEAQVDLLTRLMPQYPNLDNHCLYPPQWQQPYWQPPFQIWGGGGTYADTSAFPQYDHRLPQPQYQPWPETGPVKPDGTRSY